MSIENSKEGDEIFVELTISGNRQRLKIPSDSEEGREIKKVGGKYLLKQATELLGIDKLKESLQSKQDEPKPVEQGKQEVPASESKSQPTRANWIMEQADNGKTPQEIQAAWNNGLTSAQRKAIDKRGGGKRVKSVQAISNTISRCRNARRGG